MTPEERKLQIDTLHNEIDSLETKLYELIDTCPHEIKDTMPRVRHPEWGTGSAKCVICGSDFGWYCSKSPDHICYYFTNDRGKVQLKNGTEVDVEEHDKEYESDDDCLFCHLPDERK